jgi:hypothetical protein
MGALPPNPRDFNALLPSQVGCFFIRLNLRKLRMGDAILSLVRPRSRRSGCVPAFPYPPPRSGVVYRKMEKRAP